MEELKKILLIDNIASNRIRLRNVLADRYSTAEAENGREAIDLLSENPQNYLLVITALEMPDMDGFGLLTEIQNIVPIKNLPVLAVIDAGHSDMEVKALELGAADVIIRPYEEKVLITRVGNLIKMNAEPGFKNVMEEIVRKEINNCSNSLGICTCESCMLDLIALTLNHMKPRYVNTEKGELMSKINQLSQTSQTEIVSTIATAAEIIKKNPRHRKV